MKSDAMLHSLCALGGALLVAVFLFASVAAVSIPVTSPNDGIGVNGDCTLREAIEAANSDSVLDACPRVRVRMSSSSPKARLPFP